MYSLWGLSVTGIWGEHRQGCKVSFSHEICSKVSSILNVMELVYTAYTILSWGKALYLLHNKFLTEQGSHLHALTKFPDFLRRIFPDFRWLPHIFYIQMKQFEDDVSPSTSTINLLAYVENERAWSQGDSGYIWKYAKRSEAKKIPAMETFFLIGRVWKLYSNWPGSDQNSLTFPNHSQGIKNNSLIFPKS